VLKLLLAFPVFWGVFAGNPIFWHDYSKDHFFYLSSEVLSYPFLDGSFANIPQSWLRVATIRSS
jgi:hypothetical protein